MLLRRNTAPFYRSEVTRWGFVLTGMLCAFALSPLAGESWRSAPSLLWLHQFLPWSVLVVALTVHSLLLLWGDVRGVIVADAIGLVIYGWELVALLWTFDPTRPSNPLSLCAVALVCVLYYTSGRLAVFQLFGDGGAS